MTPDTFAWTRSGVGVELSGPVGEILATHVTLVLYGDGGTVVIPRPPATQPPTSGVSTIPAGRDPVSRHAIAAWLTVSTRWVERHLKPWAQASPRGRAWYTRDDVDAQLAQVPEHKRPPSRRSAAVDALTPAQRRARREAATGGSAFEGVAHAKEVAVMEARLRASVEKGDRSKGRKRRGER